MPELAPTTMACRKTRLMRVLRGIVRPRAGWRPGAESGSVARGSDLHTVPEQAACDHQALDLRRALVDLHDARVAVVAFDRVLLHVTVATMDLNGLVRHVGRGLGGVELGDAGGADEILPRVLEPRGALDEQARGRDAAIHLGELELDGLEPGDRRTPRLALLRVARGLVEGRGHHPPHRPGRDTGARAPSNDRVTVSEPRSPILSSDFPIVSPGVSFSTMNPLIPLGPGPPVRANTRNVHTWRPFVTQFFSPFRT